MSWRRRPGEARRLIGLPIDGADAYLRKRGRELDVEHRMETDRLSRELRLGKMPEDPGPPPPFRPSRLRKYRDLFERAGQVLLDRGSIEILTNGEPLRARLHRFRDGTGVFEYEYRGPHGSGDGMSRLEPGSIQAETLARYLEFALLNVRVRPIAGQEI